MASKISDNDTTCSEVKKKKNYYLTISIWDYDGFISWIDELLVGKLIFMGSDIEILATKMIPYYTVMFYDS